MTTSGLLDVSLGPPTPQPQKPPGILRRILSFFQIDNPADKRLRSTAYLDGVRGFMAFLVYIHHHELWAHGAGANMENVIFENGFGYNDKYRFATLPIVRNFFTGGHMAVSIFFVISGYVLAAKPLSLIIDRDYGRMTESLGSSMFRRWFRLYFPIFVTTFVYVASWHVIGYWVPNAEQQGSLKDELWNWYTECKNLSFIYKEGAIWLSFNTHVWSIPLEMRGSVVTFTTLLALHRAGTRKRLWSLVILAWYSLYVADAYYCALFCTGIILCDLDLLRARNHPDYPGILVRLSRHKTVLSCFFFFIGLLLAGVPSQTNDLNNMRKSPGWAWLSIFKPQAVFDYKWFYLYWASLCMMASLPNLPIKSLFETRFCQYLGRISYALYLVHGPILSAVGDRTYYTFGWVRLDSGNDEVMSYWASWFAVPRAGPMGLELSFLLPHLFLAPLTFGTANLVTRYVDDQAVSLSAMLYRFVCGGSGSAAESQPQMMSTRTA